MWLIFIPSLNFDFAILLIEERCQNMVTQEGALMPSLVFWQQIQKIDTLTIVLESFLYEIYQEASDKIG